MTHAMIDLETLSTRFDAAVISVGVAIFNDSQVIAADGWAIKPGCIHGDISVSTVFWWADPERDSARAFSFTGQETDVSVAFKLKSFLAQHNADEMWANDPEFDRVILQSWWARVEARNNVNLGDFPLHYRKSRSYRTLIAEAERLGHDPKSSSGIYVAHNPIEDAAMQARVVIAARKMIGGAQ